MTIPELSIVEIAQLPGYKALLATFDEEVALIEAEMAAEEDIRQGVKKLVYWQFLKHIVDILKNYPDRLREFLAQERDRAMYESLGQLSIPQASAVLREVYAKKLAAEGTKTLAELQGNE